MVIKSIIGATCTCLAVVSFSAYAALVERLGGLAYYDTEANLTWLADANYAQTSDYDDFLYGGDTNGRMSWSDAVQWASSLNISDVTGWRLPDSEICFGYNCTGSEMGNLFYNVLGNAGVTLNAGPYNSGPFSNIVATGYWTRTADSTNTAGAFVFSMNNGSQGTQYIGNRLPAMAVHDGDVAATVVPIPSAVWLFGSGLIGLVGVVRRKTS